MIDPASLLLLVFAISLSKLLKTNQGVWALSPRGLFIGYNSRIKNRVLHVNALILIVSFILLYILPSIDPTFPASNTTDTLHVLAPMYRPGPVAPFTHCLIFFLSKPRTPWQGRVMLWVDLFSGLIYKKADGSRSWKEHTLSNKMLCIIFKQVENAKAFKRERNRLMVTYSVQTYLGIQEFQLLPHRCNHFKSPGPIPSPSGPRIRIADLLRLMVHPLLEFC